MRLNDMRHGRDTTLSNKLKKPPTDLVVRNGHGLPELPVPSGQEGTKKCLVISRVTIVKCMHPGRVREAKRVLGNVGT